MKQVTILVPAGNVNVSSIMGTLEILTEADAYWQKLGNRPRIKVSIAGVMAELKQSARFYSLYPVDLSEIKKHDLVIIPSVSDPDGFDRLINTYLLPLHDEHPEAFLYFAGSVAASFQNLLHEAAADANLEIATIIKEPINNLLTYYSSKN